MSIKNKIFCRICGSEDLREKLRNRKHGAKTNRYVSLKSLVGGNKEIDDEIKVQDTELRCEVCKNYSIEIDEPPDKYTLDCTDAFKIIIPSGLSGSIAQRGGTPGFLEYLCDKDKHHLMRYYQIFDDNGINPCSQNKRVGYLLKSHYGIRKLDIWLIFEHRKKETTCRFSYGGSEIECPGKE